VGLTLATLVVIVLLDLPGLWGRRGEPLAAHVRWPGLAMAGVLAVAGHLAGFRPSYVYGLVAGLGLARALRQGPEREGKQALAGALSTLAAVAAAWVAWSPVDRAVEGGTGAGAGLLTLDATLAALVVTGLTTVVFGYVPLRFMPGLDVFRWNRAAWAVTWGSAVFVALMVLADDASRQDFVGYAPAAARTTMIALFVAAFLLSVAFRAAVAARLRRGTRRRTRPPAPGRWPAPGRPPAAS
jgi:hypothetical protein